METIHKRYLVIAGVVGIGWAQFSGAEEKLYVKRGDRYCPVKIEGKLEVRPEGFALKPNPGDGAGDANKNPGGKPGQSPASPTPSSPEQPTTGDGLKVDPQRLIERIQSLRVNQQLDRMLTQRGLPTQSDDGLLTMLAAAQGSSRAIWTELLAREIVRNGQPWVTAKGSFAQTEAAILQQLEGVTHPVDAEIAAAEQQHALMVKWYSSWIKRGGPAAPAAEDQDLATKIKALIKAQSDLQNAREAELNPRLRQFDALKALLPGDFQNLLN